MHFTKQPIYTAAWLYGRLLVAAFLFTACQSSSNAINPYFQIGLSKIDSIAIARPYVKADMDYLDGVFAYIANPSIADKAEKYLRKTYYYNQDSKAVYDSALLYADSNINILQNQLSDKKSATQYINTLFEKGNIEVKVKKYDEAIRNYTAAKVIADNKLKDSCVLFHYYEGMSNVLYIQQKYLYAARLFKLKYQNAASCIKAPFSLFRIVQENMNNAGIAYYKAGMTDSALYYHNATLTYISQEEKQFSNLHLPATEFNFPRAVVYSNQANIYRQQQNYTDAENLLLKSILYSKGSTDSGFIKYLKLELAGFYFETKQLDKTGTALKELSETIDSTEITAVAGDYYKLLSAYYIKTNRPVDGHSALEKANNIRNLLEKKERQLIVTDVQREFENREAMIAYQSLKKDNEIKTNYLAIAVTAVLMIFVILFMVVYNLKRKSSYASNLTLLNTAINRKNEDLHKAFASLEQSHKENNRIMRIVAHDLKTPVSAISLLAFSLLKKEQPPGNKEALETIRSATADSISLIKNLLDNKNSLAGTSKELTDMGRLVEQCTELFQVQANEKKQLLVLYAEPLSVIINRQKIWRVISNIISNAIKFSPPGAEILIRFERKENDALLSVQDNGAGIPAAMKDKVFANNTEIPGQGAGREKHYGLSMSISKKIMEEHNGRLWFESETGKGTVFYAALPYSANQQQSFN